MTTPVQEAAEKTVNDKDQLELLKLKASHCDISRELGELQRQSQMKVNEANEVMMKIFAVEKRIADSAAKTAKRK